MCKPKAPKIAKPVAPPPPAELPKPLGIDEDGGEDGVAQLRSSRRSLSIRSRAPASAAAAPSTGTAAPGRATAGGGTPSRATAA